nr:PREDICTED: uncharacterized protein LOC105662610 isoform X1 [Megachile rotundata]
MRCNFFCKKTTEKYIVQGRRVNAGNVSIGPVLQRLLERYHQVISMPRIMAGRDAILDTSTRGFNSLSKNFLDNSQRYRYISSPYQVPYVLKDQIVKSADAKVRMRFSNESIEKQRPIAKHLKREIR